MTTVERNPGRAASGPLGPRITRGFLDGLAARVAASGRGEPIPVEMPATGALLGEVPHSTPEDLAAAAEAGRRAQRDWARVPVTDRAKVLFRFAELVLDRQTALLDVIQLENGKARRDAFEEIIDVAQVCRYYGRTAPRLLQPRRRAGALPGLTRTSEHRHPKGLVGVISPWNYPLTLGITDALPALAAGNAVLAKPDTMTPYSALFAAQLLEEAGLPHGLLQVVVGPGRELGSSLIALSDFVMFTGSTRVGRGVAAQAAERLINYSMELGGKNAILILADSDLGKATSGALRAAFSNTGQLCISVERMYVATEVWREFTGRFVAATKAMRLGHALDYGPHLGCLISAGQLATVARHVNDAIAKGATLLAGGRARPDLGPYFYEPTILTDATPDMALYSEETFGPVIALYRVSSPEEAIERANDSNYGLSFSVWTRDLARGRDIASRLAAGCVNVNEAYAASWGSIDAPMGGWKESGVGSRHGENGLLKYTDAQTVAVQRLLPLAAPHFVSQAAYARAMTAAMRALQRLPGRR
jgi:succinate-semialdehyde dehydrogenase/glutarate-semialdehyde dehydrogenase